MFMDPHGPTIAPRCPTAVIADKIKHIHFQNESKNLFLPTISVPENAGTYGSGFACTSVGSASHATHPVLAEAEGSICVTVTRACVSALACWRDPFWLKRGVILDMAHRRKVVTTDTSNKG